MKTLIVFYSRTNTTKKIAEKIAERIGADLEILVDKKNRAGAVGWLVAGKDAGRRKSTEIDNTKYDSNDYDLVILGTPVWVGNFTPAVRRYIELNKSKFKKLAFFTTQGSDKRQKVFDELEKESGKKSVAELQLTTKEVVGSQYESKLEEFIKTINKLAVDS